MKPMIITIVVITIITVTVTSQTLDLQVGFHQHGSLAADQPLYLSTLEL